MKFAYSTVACPDWTLERVARVAEELGYVGVELRSFGWGSSSSACDPALTAGPKVQRLLRAAGAEACCLSSGCRFDAVVTPPVIGWAISDTERSVREGKAMVDLAVEIGAPMLRVFAFEYPSRERRVSAIERIVSRLLKVVDAGRARQVKVVIENGGSFCTAAELCEILDEAQHPMLLAAYNVAVASLAGEDPAKGINVLGDRLGLVKVKDFADGKPVAIGDGQVPVRGAIEALRALRYRGFVSYELDRAWLGGADPMPMLRASAERLYSWGGGVAVGPRGVQLA